MKFRILGPVELWADGQRRDLGSLKERRLLAALLSEAGQPVTVETLISRVWGDVPPESAVKALHANVSRLRSTLRSAGGADGLLAQRSGSYVLGVAPADVDAWRFRELADQAASAVAEGDGERAVALFTMADALWHGIPLDGLGDGWAEGLRIRLTEERFAAAQQRIRAGLRLGRHADLVSETADLVRQRPLDEDLIDVYLRALYGSGRRAEALSAYFDAERRSLDDYGTGPGPALRNLYQLMLREDASLSVTSPSRSPDLGIPSSRLRVYLGYAQEDTEAAGEIAGDLKKRGIAVRLDRADITWGESWATHARSAVETADTFVLVVSPDSSRHVGDWEEVATALDRRGIDVVAVAVPPPVIRDLAGRVVLDYVGPSAGGDLADRIELGAAISFDKLSGRQFETLVAELLPRYGYTPAWTAGLATQSDSGYDLRFVDDSDGQEILVEVKAYRDGGRISVNEIYRLAAIASERDARGILVTTGQLTSVAREAMDGLNDAGARLQVIDGFSLRQILLANPDLARLHMTGPSLGTVPR